MLATSKRSAEESVQFSAESRVLILSQLERVLESPAFRTSKRYPRFLRYVVEQTLSGNAHLLKERVLAVEVFDRAADYDPSIDPVVRVAGGEIRKRLAKYYVDHAHDSEIRIGMEPGSYIPQFAFPLKEFALAAESSTPEPEARIEPSHPQRLHSARPWITAAVFAITCTLCLSAVTINLIRRSDPVRKFWKPFLQAAHSPLICVGGATYALHDESTAMRTGVTSQDYLALGDVDALHRISSTLSGMGKPVTLSNADSVNFSDLSQHPAILIGGSPNSWTMREMQYLPLQLVPNFSTGITGIVSRNEPSKLLWSVNFHQPLTAVPKEYAIIARFHNPETGQLMLIAAGVGAKGEVSAGEFLTDSANLKQFIDHAPSGWQDRNLEIVLELQMIDGVSGPPHVVSAVLW